jgi:hypothetical protein
MTESEPHHRDLIGNHPLLWMQCGHGLMRAAAILAEAISHPKRFDGTTDGSDFAVDLLPPLVMLRAHAVEAFLKCIWVAQGNDAVKDGELQEAVQSHRLVRWARDAGVQVTEDKHSMLSTLARYLELGRYPIERKASADGNMNWSAEHEQTFEAFVRKIWRPTFVGAVQSWQPKPFSDGQSPTTD